MLAFFRAKPFLPPPTEKSLEYRLLPRLRRTKLCSEAGPAAMQGNLVFLSNMWVWKALPLDLQQPAANFLLLGVN